MADNILTLPLRTTPVCSALLGACLVAWLLPALGGAALEMRLAMSLGVVPGLLSGDLRLNPAWQLAPLWLTPLTALFLHGGLTHLLGNMLFLWAVGRPLELTLGGGRTLALYLASGIAGNLFQAWMTAPSPVPVIGASGAISGLFAAYLILFARRRPGDDAGFFRRALGYLGVWLILQAGMVIIQPQMGGGGIAIWTHVGGFIAGLALIVLIRPQVADS